MYELEINRINKSAVMYNNIKDGEHLSSVLRTLRSRPNCYGVVKSVSLTNTGVVLSDKVLNKKTFHVGA